MERTAVLEALYTAVTRFVRARIEKSEVGSR
jgi:hypothetical protein